RTMVTHLSTELDHMKADAARGKSSAARQQVSADATKKGVPDRPSMSPSIQFIDRTGAEEASHRDHSVDGKPAWGIVQPGESLWLLAKRHGLTVESLKALNNLTSDQLTVGQQLLLSRTGPQAHIAP